MKTHALLLVSLITSTTLSAAEATLPRIPIAVRSAGTAEGYTDPSPGRQASVEDLRRKLAASKSLAVVDADGEALVVLEVLDRDTRGHRNLLGRHNKSSLTVRLTAGDYSTDFRAESGTLGVLTAYGAAAGKVAKQVEAWVAANRERLRAQSAPAASF
jgi:hypothetical protein